MLGQIRRAGLSPRFRSAPPFGSGVEDFVTVEAGIVPPRGTELRIDPLVSEGDVVAQGAPLASLRGAPSIRLVAPMPARVARIVLMPGRRLSEIVLFHEPGQGRHRHGFAGGSPGTEATIRDALQQGGLWPLICRRPFGGLPAVGERPAAIVVMGVDTRPLAPCPHLALEGREEGFNAGLAALGKLTDGRVFLCAGEGALPVEPATASGQFVQVRTGNRHPQGLAGFRIHDLTPASIDKPVWSCHAEDVAAMGELLTTGYVPPTRLVNVAGEGLRHSRLVRTQPGADVRGLTHLHTVPGPHRLLSGSPLEGVEVHWLGTRDRQVSVVAGHLPHRDSHWFLTALSRSARSYPVIPTRALTEAFGAALPAAAFVRALSAGDDETAMRLGLLSFLQEDMALADFVLGGEARLGGLLNAMLARVKAEAVA
jgi:Na+-transporting NADH:ubiquinone oxidoreductase subunit A